MDVVAAVGLEPTNLSIMSRALLPTELRRRDRCDRLASLLWESNPRPFPYHGNALPTELRRRAAPRLGMTTG